MINIIKDVDLYDHLNDYDIILIGTNHYCTMSQGIQLKVMLNYPYVQNKNMETRYGDPAKLGTILECANDGEPTFCLCFMVNGYNFRPDKNKEFISYEALEKCLKLVNIRYRGKKIASPLLGVSRFEGNGDRDKIMEIFNNCIKDVDLTIYDFYDKSRAEQMKDVWVIEREAFENDRDRYYELVRKRKAEAEERFKKNGHRRY